MSWCIVSKGDKRALSLADRHYTRQKPGTPQFCRPGKNIVLLSQKEDALWVTWSGIRDDGWNAWECTIFRNEGKYLSSHLIVLALGITRHLWGLPPEDGLITYVGKHLRGGCFFAAGFHKAGHSKSGKLLLQLDKERMPPALDVAETGLFMHDIIVC